MNNKLLDEYQKQLEDILDEKEVKKHEEYSFYDVYSVSISRNDGDGGGCTCCLVICGVACCCWSIETHSCGF